MASMGGGTDLRWETVQNVLRSSGMVNRILQSICVAENLNKNGVKADLQQRIIDRLRYHSQRGDAVAFNRLKRMIENPSSINQPIPQLHFGNHSSSPAATPPAPRLGPGNNHNMAAGMNGFRAHGHQNFEFKPSPYYLIQQQLGETKECLAMTAHRHTVTIPLRVSDHPILSRIQNDPSLRVMVFCAADGQGRQDIAFPHQSEIKVNGGDVKANLRGLKNKPGSTRPVDITKDLRLNLAAYSNTVEMTYALTNKASGSLPEKFYLLLFVVKTVPVLDLVKKLETGKRITKETVINDMVNKSRDADIVATASVLSLKCPLSTLRIDLPVRSMTCRHNQCFDATSYLQLQEQGPTWLCPICNNSAPFETLAVDEYVKDILKSTSKSTDQVTIQPNGQWELHNKQNNTPKPNGVASDDDDDDEDLVEITKSGDSVRMGTPRVQGTPVNGHLAISREQSSSSTAQRSIGSTSSKRPIADVIDLTSSGDEEVEPVAKRQFSNGFGKPPAPVYRPAPTNGYTPHK